MRAISVQMKGKTVSKHNSHGFGYYRSLACTLGKEPVIVAHEGNSHKGTKLWRNDLLRLIVFLFKNGRAATQKQAFFKHNLSCAYQQIRLGKFPLYNTSESLNYPSGYMFYLFVWVFFLTNCIFIWNSALARRVTTEAHQWLRVIYKYKRAFSEELRQLYMIETDWHLLPATQILKTPSGRTDFGLLQ